MRKAREREASASGASLRTPHHRALPSKLTSTRLAADTQAYVSPYALANRKASDESKVSVDEDLTTRDYAVVSDREQDSALLLREIPEESPYSLAAAVPPRSEEDYALAIAAGLVGDSVPTTSLRDDMSSCNGDDLDSNLDLHAELSHPGFADELYDSATVPARNPTRL